LQILTQNSIHPQTLQLTYKPERLIREHMLDKMTLNPARLHKGIEFNQSIGLQLRSC